MRKRGGGYKKPFQEYAHSPMQARDARQSSSPRQLFRHSNDVLERDGLELDGLERDGLEGDGFASPEASSEGDSSAEEGTEGEPDNKRTKRSPAEAWCITPWNKDGWAPEQRRPGWDAEEGWRLEGWQPDGGWSVDPEGSQAEELAKKHAKLVHRMQEKYQSMDQLTAKEQARLQRSVSLYQVRNPCR